MVSAEAERVNAVYNGHSCPLPLLLNLPLLSNLPLLLNLRRC